MFDFLFQKKNKEMQSMAEVIALDLEKLNLSKLAIEKAVMMIARAIAKSDIIVQTDSTQKSSIEYRLNVMPNDHECGTYFWTRIIRELLWTQEALIIPMNGKYYKASAWQVSNSVLSERIYKAAFTIAGYYTMGTTGVRVNEYDQTKAMENADLIIASCYANGRAVDDNVAVIFDVTKLEEYVLPVTQATIVQAGQE